MILLINGSFGIGKTTVARLLCRLLKGSAIYDPEWAGLVLKRMPSVVGLRGAGTDDFQDIHLWRKSVVAGVKLTRMFARGAVIVPMTFSQRDYFQEVLEGICRFDNDVQAFCLKAEMPTILQRLQCRGLALDSEAGSWVTRKAQACVAAHGDAYFGEPVITDGINATEVSQEILKRIWLTEEMSKPNAKTSKPKAERQDYDSPWKEVLEQFFEQCFEFFFPAAHAAIDWARGVEFLDKEMQQIVADAELGRRLADKLAKVWLRDGTELRVIVHLEVQGERQREFEERIYVYSFRSFDRYRCPVASFAILTDEHPNWRPSAFGYQVLGTELRLKFTSLKLLDFAADWDKLTASDNPFAIVVMAHLKTLETKGKPQQRYRWKLEIIKGLYDCGYSPLFVRQLMRFIDWVMRLPVELEPHFKADLAKIEEEHRMQYVTSWERLGREDGLKQGLQEGRQEGRQKGLQEGAVAITLRMLQRKVGTLSLRVEKRIRQLPLEKVEQLSDALADFKTARDLNAWLKEHAQ